MATAPAAAPLLAPPPPPPPLFPAPPPPPILGFNCTKIDCYDNEISDNQIVTTIWFAAIVGVVCLLVFGIFRKNIDVYSTRLFLPQVHIKPPHLPVGGIQQLWTWLYPVFKTSDIELLHTAGFDSLMMSWMTTLAIQILVPMTLVGCIVLLPVNLSQHRIKQEALTASDAVSTFSTLTLSNIPRGSGLYWLPFGYVYLSCGWIMCLLCKYYSAFVSLRQRFLTSGELSTNEWHEQYIQPAVDDKSKPETGRNKVIAALRHLQQLFDPNEVENIVEGEPSMHVGPITAVLSRLTSTRSFRSARTGRMLSSRAMSHNSNRSSQHRWGYKSVNSSEQGLFQNNPNLGLALGSARGTRPSMADAARGLAKSAEGQLASLGKPKPAPLTPHNLKALPQDSESVQSAQAVQRLPPLQLQMSPSSSPRGRTDSPREGRHVGFSDSFRMQTVTQPVGVSETAQVAQAVPAAVMQAPVEQQMQASGMLDNSDIVSVSHIGLQSSTPALPSHLQPPVPGLQPEALPDQTTYQGEGTSFVQNPVYRSELADAVGLQPAPPDLGRTGYPAAEKARARRKEHVQMVQSSQSPGGVSKPKPVAEGVEEQPPLDAYPSFISRESHRNIYGAPAPQLISKYERNTPPETVDGQPAREAVYKWWRTDNVPANEQGRRLMGKPSVRFRKVVNTTAKDGTRVAVSAQQYCVLVMDVPDVDRLIRREAKLAKLAAEYVPPCERLKRWWQGRRKAVDPASDAGSPQTGRGSMSAQSNTDVETGHPDTKVALHQSSQDKEAQTAASNMARFRPASVQPPWNTRDPPAEGQAPAEVQAPVLVSPFAVAQAEGSECGTSQTKSTVVDLGRYAMYDLNGDGHVSMRELLHETFRQLFPSYDTVLEVRDHQAIDMLLFQWDAAYRQLEQAEVKYEETGCTQRPAHRMRCCGCTGDRVDSIDFWSVSIRDLEHRIVEARKKALAAPPTRSWLVFFRSQKDAAIAAQTNLHAEDGHSFRVIEAPGPEEVNWPVLWRPWLEREVREFLVLPLIVLIILVPIGLFSGIIAQLTITICASGEGGRFYSSWYCDQKSVGRSLFTSVLPPLLLMLWQALVMPNALYRFAWIESRSQSASLSGLDRRICDLYFLWDVFNVFLGAMFGGAIFSQLSASIKDPAGIPELVGTALPGSSNFFINYIITQAFALIPFRIMFPHIGVLCALFRVLHLCGQPKSDRDKVASLWPHSVRYGREVGTMMLIYIIALAYAATSPIILPFALLYFIFSWIFWRYNMLYVSERCFESGGRIWEQIFRQICWCMFIFEFFTACVLLSNSAYVQASILFASATPAIFKFYRYCSVRYGSSVAHMPLETADAAPTAQVDPLVYMPPALRPGAAGWYPEYGKAWEAWGAPTYSY